MPTSISTSATRVVMNALTPASIALVLWNQKPISEYEQKPITSQPTNSSSRLSASASVSIAPANSDR